MGQRSQPGHGGHRDPDGSEEGLGAPVIEGGDPTPALEASEEVLNLVRQLVESSVVAGVVLACASGRDAGDNPLVLNGFAAPIGIVALVSKSVFTSGKASSRTSTSPHRSSDWVIGRGRRTACTIAHHMQLGVQPDFGPYEDRQARAAFERLAAVRCALR